MVNTAKDSLPVSLNERLTMSDVNPENVEALLNSLKEKANFYQAEIDKMEALFQNLGVTSDRSKVFDEAAEALEKLTRLKEQFSDIKELTPNAVALSFTDKLRKHDNYAAKMKIYIKTYLELNEALSRRIKQLKNNSQQAQKQTEQVGAVSEDEIKTIEKKISRYQNELLKMEKNNPWLKNSDYSLANISKEISQLKEAQSKRDELVKELSCYSGLKADMVEATEQLAKLKQEHEQICNKFR